ncbi:MAG: mechanosensitive ion channel family protein [Candidatus Nanopelagicaceae bacterium]
MNELLPGWAFEALKLSLILVSGVSLRFVVQRSLKLFINRVIDLKEDSSSSNSASRGNLRANTLVQLSNSMTTAAIFGLTLLLVLDQLGVNLAPLLAGASVAGIAIGFGAQAFVKDLFAGISVLAEDQYGVGDVIDFGESSGVVESITLKSTRVRALDGTLWHIPNGEISRVANKTQGWSRAILDVSVSYSSDIEDVIEKIQKILDDFSNDPKVSSKLISSPEIWGVENLGDNSVDIRIAIKVLPGEHWQLMRDLRLILKQRFDSLGIEIPFPQLKIWTAELGEQ